jgi:hypothetical protein
MFEIGAPQLPGDAVIGVEPQNNALTRALARRDHHRRRPLVVRVLTAAAGALVGVIALALFLAPELALPLLVAALGLLALEFSWAPRALASVLDRAARFKGWFGRRPRPLRIVRVALAKRRGV